MKDQDINKLIQTLSKDPTFDREFDVVSLKSEMAKQSDLDSSFELPAYGFRDYFEYYVWQFTHAMVKPVAASLAVFFLAITGWVSAANATANVLPGDPLYSIKLGMEQVQLRLAFGSHQRAELQVEFASRRLNEMVELASLNREGNEALHLAVAQVKTQVETIQERLSDENQNAADLAKAVNRNVETYQETVSTAGDLPEEVLEEVQAVQQILEDTEEQAVDVIITAHELTEDTDAAHELELTFEKELARIQVSYADTAADEIELAIALKKEGAYRRAFQVLREIELIHTQETTE